MVSKGEEGRDKLGIQDEQIYTGGGLVAKLCPTLVTPWTVAPEALLSMRFFRQEHWRELPFPPPGNIPNPGIKTQSPMSSALQEDSLPSELSGKLHIYCLKRCNEENKILNHSISLI